MIATRFVEYLFILNRYIASQIEKNKKVEQIHLNNTFTSVYLQHKYSYVYLSQKYLLLFFGLFTFELWHIRVHFCRYFSSKGMFFVFF